MSASKIKGGRLNGSSKRKVLVKGGASSRIMYFIPIGTCATPSPTIINMNQRRHYLSHPPSHYDRQVRLQYPTSFGLDTLCLFILDVLFILPLLFAKTCTVFGRTFKFSPK